MSMHWGVNDREDVKCDGGNCPDTQAECAGETITYHGHEVVAEVRQFLGYPTHFFAECQAVNAYENTVPNPDWPYLDDPDRVGHFLTTIGNPPDCPCSDGDFECVAGGCDSGARDCCLPKDNKELGAGFMIASQPNADTLQFLHPEVPYHQLDGDYGTVGGSEPAYNLSTFLGTTYKNDREVTFITGPNGPGDEDVWMTGFVDGECDILGDDDVNIGGGTDCNGGKVSYLGGHEYSTNVPISANPTSQGTRMFLNALFEADCVTSVGQPNMQLELGGDLIVGAQTVPVERSYTATYTNTGRGFALAGVLAELVDAQITVVTIDDNGTAIANGAEWNVGSIASISPVAGDPPNTGGRGTTLSFPDYGQYSVDLRIDFQVGASVFQVSRGFMISVEQDTDGDTIADSIDPDPNDPNVCGDSDSDTCDDCAVAGMPDPFNDGPDADNNGVCDAGEDMGPPGTGDDNSGCGCRVSSPSDAAPWLLVLLGLAILRRRRRR
jgi:MYXO-CTERM domain-containing protein